MARVGVVATTFEPEQENGKAIEDGIHPVGHAVLEAFFRGRDGGNVGHLTRVYGRPWMVLKGRARPKGAHREAILGQARALLAALVAPLGGHNEKAPPVGGADTRSSLGAVGWQWRYGLGQHGGGLTELRESTSCRSWPGR